MEQQNYKNPIEKTPRGVEGKGQKRQKEEEREFTHVDFIWVTIEMAEDRSPKSTKWKRVAEKTRERENKREKLREGLELPFWVQLSDGALIGFGVGSTSFNILLSNPFINVERETKKERKPLNSTATTTKTDTITQLSVASLSHQRTHKAPRTVILNWVIWVIQFQSSQSSTNEKLVNKAQIFKQTKARERERRRGVSYFQINNGYVAADLGIQQQCESP